MRPPSTTSSPGKSPGFKRRGSRMSADDDLNADGFIDRSEKPELSRGHTPVTGIRTTAMVRPESRASAKSGNTDFQDPRGAIND